MPSLFHRGINGAPMYRMSQIVEGDITYTLRVNGRRLRPMSQQLYSIIPENRLIELQNAITTHALRHMGTIADDDMVDVELDTSSIAFSIHSDTDIIELPILNTRIGEFNIQVVFDPFIGNNSANAANIPNNIQAMLDDMRVMTRNRPPLTMNMIRPAKPAAPSLNTVRNVGNIAVSKNATDPISYNEFVEGEEVVRLQGNDRFIFKRPGLQTWFQTSPTNPLTREAVNMSRVEKGKAKLVGGRRKTRKGRKGRKARKSRRTRSRV
jgi:hypothetical protein